MATNYLQPGEVITLLATANIASGDPVRVGHRQMGIATTDIASGALGSVALSGVWTLPKNTSDALVQGQRVWWDPTAEECINAPVTGSLFLGHAFAAAGASAVTCAVALEEFCCEGPRLITLAATGDQALAVADFLSGDLTVLVPNTAALSVSLPAVANLPDGVLMRVRKTHATAQAITLDPNASETIAGGASFASLDANNDMALFALSSGAWVLIDSAIA